MTAAETLRGNPKHLDRLNSFLTEDEVGALFLKALTEKVLAGLPTTHDQANHGTIFRAGKSSGAGELLSFIHSFDPIAVAEELAAKAADAKLREVTRLPSAQAAILRRTGKEVPEFNKPRPNTGEKIT